MAIDLEALDELQRERLRDMGVFVPGLPMAKKRSKYNAMRTEYNGVMYDSKAEAEYARDLDVQKEAGDISFWWSQVLVPLGPDFSTRVDFLVFTATRSNPNFGWFKIHAAEVKGAETREFKRVRKLWPKYVEIPLCIVKRGEIEVIEGKH